MFLVYLPILIPFVTAIGCLFAWRRVEVQRPLSIIGNSVALLTSVVLLLTVWQNGILTAETGSWPAPFGIVLVADLLSGIMCVLAALMGWAVSIYALANIAAPLEERGFHALYNFLLVGVSGSFLTGDIFNLFVWFEVMLIASFVLLSLRGRRDQLEGAIKYVALNIVSSTIFLAAIGILYGITGSLNMADLALRLNDAPQGFVLTVGMMFFVAFGIKAAVFPLYGWLPAAYHTPPAAISAIFAGLLTKVGVYAMLRVFTLLFVQDIEYTHKLVISTVAGFTMVIGVLGAASQNHFRRILSFHIVSQIGYMVMGIGIFTPLAIAGTIFYIMHHIIVKTNLFLVSGLVNRLSGSYQLKELGGLYSEKLGVAILFFVPAMALAGIPPLSGFWAKFTLVRAGLEAEQYVVVAASLLVSVLTLFSMTKIWAQVFWKPRPAGSAPPETLRGQERVYYYLPIISLASLTFLFAFFAGPLFELAQRASEQLLTPSGYITAVLGGGS